MKRRSIAIISAAALTVAGLTTGLIVWLSQPSYDDIVKDCQKALAAQSKAGGEGKPSDCNGVKKDDYGALVISNAFDNLPQKDQDVLDYYDDGSINDSIGGDTP
ncbi:hypothetical protein [Streptomyces purpurascens]|uniref:hypothetical protein n=1 Tax=Streptomyces purpurascens TaxID=1924 RepID=UPI0016752527|nr:hypothetical protein [Streptomyces purpurascens]MCE7049546.1 hypothetical protein [Streptomyces purpurascens]